MPAAAPTRWQPYAVYLLRLIQCVLYRIACARTREYTLSRRWANSASPNRLPMSVRVGESATLFFVRSMPPGVLGSLQRVSP
jgi:hypothetical protein